MGPSGSGKTTLLNVLAHRPGPAKATNDGRVFINGAPATPATLRQASAYVEQQDSLIGSLTARETLDFAARLSLPASVDDFSPFLRPSPPAAVAEMKPGYGGR